MTLLASALVAVLLTATASLGSVRLVATRQVVATSSSQVGRRWPNVNRAALASTATLALAVALVGVAPAIVLASVCWLALRWRALLARRQLTATRRAALPDAIDTFVLLVHAGLTPRLAVERLAETAPAVVRPAFVAVVERMRRGDTFADALTGLLDHFGAGAVALVDLVAASSRYGLPISDVLAQLSNETRASRRRLDEAAARALPVRLSFPLVVCTLPSFVLLAIAPAVLAALSSLGGTAW